MNLYTQALKQGALLIRGVDDKFGEEIKLTLVLDNRGGGVCEATSALGDLCDDTNIKIGLIALNHGYTRLDFHAARGSNVTRHADYVRSDRHWDYYTVDLLATAERLGIEGI